MEPVSKRLHISGLTPQVTSSDLAARFSSFGTVKALDGVGKLDGNGQPRPYAYLTLETSKPQLAKCLNLLSGSTWKGAKLRIGEAKADFRERITRENQLAQSDDSTRPKKRKRLSRGSHGIHSADMSLVTPQNISSRSGWHSTPMGRLIRPMRIRPIRPLGEPPVEPEKAVKGKRTKEAECLAKKKRKYKDLVLVRQRRRIIDPSKWGSEYLKGVLLEGSLPGTGTGDGLKVTKGKKTPLAQLFAQEDLDPTLNRPSPVLSHQSFSVEIEETAISDAELEPNTPPFDHLEGADSEKARNLGLLESLFGGKDENEWGTAESIPSDVEMDVNEHGEAKEVKDDDEDEGIKVDVSQDKKVDKKKTLEANDQTTSVQMSSEVKTSTAVLPNTNHPQPRTVQMSTLKDIFAPSQVDDGAGFSLLGSLGIDLNFDDSVLELLAPEPIAAPISASQDPVSNPNDGIAAAVFTPQPEPQPQIYNQPRAAFDGSKPLFFPFSLFDDSDNSSLSSRNRPKDFLEVIKERGWFASMSNPNSNSNSNFTHTSNTNTNPNRLRLGANSDEAKKDKDVFWRTESEEEIRKRWEDSKVELTKTWKRRHREAMKSMRRRGGNGMNENTDVGIS